jgi:hypothetical protein
MCVLHNSQVWFVLKFYKCRVITYFLACTYNQTRTRGLSTTAYILALEERVEILQAEIARASKHDSTSGDPGPKIHTKDDIHPKKTTNRPKILLETMVGKVGETQI